MLFYIMPSGRLRVGYTDWWAEWFQVLWPGVAFSMGPLVWAVADEGLVPVLGLAPPPSQVKLADRGFGLSAHLVFGLALDFSRRQLNRLISVP